MMTTSAKATLLNSLDTRHSPESGTMTLIMTGRWDPGLVRWRDAWLVAEQAGAKKWMSWSRPQTRSCPAGMALSDLS